MKNTLFLIGAVVTSIILVVILPQFVLAWLGCWQIGSWVGDIANKLREN